MPDPTPDPETRQGRVVTAEVSTRLSVPQPADPMSDPCDQHTYGPAGQLAWHEWAERKIKTHTQTECVGCGMFLIWTPKVPT